MLLEYSRIYISSYPAYTSYDTMTIARVPSQSYGLWTPPINRLPRYLHLGMK